MEQRGLGRLPAGAFFRGFATAALAIALALAIAGAPSAHAASTPVAALSDRSDTPSGTADFVFACAIPTDQVCAQAWKAAYIAYLDPICQTFVGPMGHATRSFNRNLKRLFRLANSGTLKAFIRQNSRTARSLSRLAQSSTQLTDQIAAAQPPAADAGTIGTWLNYRRQADAFARSAASALKKLDANRFFRQLDRADKAETASRSAISGFGFQVCGVSV